jgi:hypothetical protein
MSDPFREFGIAQGLSGRNLLKRLPDAMLEGGAAHIERKV